MRTSRFMIATAVAAATGLAGLAAVPEQPPDGQESVPRAVQAAVDPKPLSQNVERGLEWLARTQLDSGGWGQGEAPARMAVQPGAQEALQDEANVGDTATVTLALLRSGSSPGQGPYATHIHRGVEYICAQVEASDEQSLSITDVRNTRLQSKLGTYVDTFLAAWALAEVKDQMPDEAGRDRVGRALAKTIAKIERNQQENGGWAMRGWAPALAQGLGAKAINRAAQTGAPVDDKVLRRAERYARADFDAASGAIRGVGEAGAGVELYSRASNVQVLKDADDTNRLREQVLMQKLAEPAAVPADERAGLERELEEIGQVRGDLAAARRAVVNRVQDERFVAGFGSNGGEEFLSYMKIGEALVAEGGQEWEEWDRAMTANLNRIQNNDGSWSGHHCITGKTFCTSAALLTLMVDRMTVAAPEALRPDGREE